MNMRWRSFFTGLFICWFSLNMPASADTTAVIKQAQQNLKKLRYYHLNTDGIVGNETRKAVLQYQYEMDLPITGTLDATTIKHLNRPSVVLNTQNFAPFHYKTAREGEADGPIPQIVSLACNNSGINCRIVMYDNWRLAQEDVQNGKADGLFVIAWNSGRAKWLHRSVAIVETEYGLFVRDIDRLKFFDVLQRPAILEGYTIGVYGPSGTSTSLSKLKTALESKGVGIAVDMQSEDHPLFQKLSLSAEKYAVYSNRIVGESITKGLGLSNTRYAGHHRGLAYYVGFSKQRVPVSLVETFNKAYMDLVEQGEVLSIMANHSMPIPKRYHQRVVGADDGKAPATGEDIPSKRFTKLYSKGIAVVKDATTCLMWQQSGTTKYCNWDEALAYVEKLNNENYAGFSDWRLPLIGELTTLMEKNRQKTNRMHIHSIFDAMQQTCWSNDKNGADIKFADFLDGRLDSKDQSDTNFVRAVRNAECN